MGFGGRSPADFELVRSSKYPNLQIKIRDQNPRETEKKQLV
jgi:hypothetical protein